VRQFLRALILSAAIAFAASPGQGRAYEGLEAQYEALFQQLQETPNDLRLMAQFANVATRLDNYEAAITVLQRMLMINPGAVPNPARARRAVLPLAQLCHCQTVP
jgi:lipopolysaccharide biosynthesis regulator YciM